MLKVLAAFGMLEDERTTGECIGDRERGREYMHRSSRIKRFPKIRKGVLRYAVGIVHFLAPVRGD